MSAKDDAEQVDELLAMPHLAEALENEHFKRFLDNMPIPIVVAEMEPRERIIYVNRQFEKISGQEAGSIEGKAWSALNCHLHCEEGGCPLGDAVTGGDDHLGTFRLECEGHEPALVDAYTSVIENDEGDPAFRLAALVDVTPYEKSRREEFEQRIREKDMLLKEIQHRVKNNLQMITALIRLEARDARKNEADTGFDRLAGRIESLQILYEALSDDGQGKDIDLGIYLSRIASAVMDSHAIEGIRLDLKVDSCPVSINVAMPVGLVVNEVLTNALKYAFEGRGRGTITLHCLAVDDGYRVMIADDGVGLPEGVAWPARGKLGYLMVQSLRENAKARLTVDSAPGRGLSVLIEFSRMAAATDHSRDIGPPLDVTPAPQRLSM